MIAAKPLQLGPTPEFITRNYQQADEGLIYSSWTKGAYEVSPTNFIPRQIYLKQQSEYIKACITNYPTVVLCHPDDPNELFGYLCYSFVGETLLIHWMYIRGGPGEWRNRGIARELLTKLYPEFRTKPIIITQYSKFFKAFRHAGFNLIYDPYYNIEHLGA